MSDDSLQELQSRLEDIEYDTLGGGRCLATVTEVTEEPLDRVSVTVELPSGRPYTEVFSIPEVADDSSRLVRFLEARGYALSTIEHLPGSDVEVKISDDGPMFVVPDQPTPWRHRLIDNVPDDAITALWYTALALTFPVTGLPAIATYADDADDRMVLIMLYTLSMVLWLIIMAFVLTPYIGWLPPRG